MVKRPRTAKSLLERIARLEAQLTIKESLIQDMKEHQTHLAETLGTAIATITQLRREATEKEMEIHHLNREKARLEQDLELVGTKMKRMARERLEEVMTGKLSP
jgi:chromosome segregation ATPase